MASGPIAYWTYGFGGLFVLMNAMNLLLGCSKAMSSWDLGNYICGDLEEELFFSISTVHMSAFSMLMMVATVVDCNFVMAEIIAGAFIVEPILINGHGVPGAVWFVLGFAVGTFAIAAVMGLKGEVSAEPKSPTFGALNKWVFGIGGFLYLTMAGALALGRNNTLEAFELFMVGMKCNQGMVILMMAATTTANRTDLLKISAPMMLCNLAQLVNAQQFLINGHSVPGVSMLQAVCFTTFFIAVIMHDSDSARQVNPTDCELLVAV